MPVDAQKLDDVFAAGWHVNAPPAKSSGVGNFPGGKPRAKSGIPSALTGDNSKQAVSRGHSKSTAAPSSKETSKEIFAGEGSISLDAAGTAEDSEAEAVAEAELRAALAEVAAGALPG